MRPLRFGYYSGRVCWLVKPSSFDEQHMPEHFTLEYELRVPYANRRPGMVIARSFDREAVARVSIDLYRQHRPHDFATHWYDEMGQRVHKPLFVKSSKLLEKTKCDV